MHALLVKHLEGTTCPSQMTVNPFCCMMFSSSDSLIRLVFGWTTVRVKIKNLVLHSMLLALVNKTDGPEIVILRYLVPGHTRMTEDSIHGNLEKAIKKKNVYDMDDLSEVMAGAARNISIMDMSIADIREWPNLCKMRSRSKSIPLF